MKTVAILGAVAASLCLTPAVAQGNGGFHILPVPSSTPTPSSTPLPTPTPSSTPGTPSSTPPSSTPPSSTPPSSTIAWPFPTDGWPFPVDGWPFRGHRAHARQGRAFNA
ncbi:hypothetical protein EYZ11_011724 [Aspergillus tanneri]|uniref:Uncharacterized protein n=1 Tax=Aspergillus tanneri TaxID=1220188 RepID=A0A4S3J226_9EURO|nr:uncharacterized protein ATNIH1004_007560 [Aspergillus tanneri]KAA8646134.1 hypothetical protein ATNIH1004_007560 [Aspergillus tanneri]THC88830.1 hypothetical protein EYZ11_011724 [Aspergillus tanneri]